MSKTIKLSGNTFQHRDTIKRLGGKFDGVSKSWTLPDTQEVRNYAMGWSGVNVSEPTEEYQPNTATPPRTPNQSRFSRAFGGSVPSSIPAKMPQDVVGNSEEHIATFGSATNFGGFDSLTAFVDFVQNIPEHIVRDNRRNNGWRVDLNRDEFTRTQDMAAAIKLTRHGWVEGIRMAEKVTESIVGQHPTRRRRVHSVAGGSVNVGRMLAGNPLHMRQRVKQPTEKVVTLIHAFNSSHSVNSGDMEIRAAIVAAIADTLEDNGYSCEILAAASNAYGISKGYEADPDRRAIDVIKLKSAGERLNLSDIMFGMGHPSFLRRLAFARWACIEPFPYKHMGFVGSLKTEAPNTYLIKHLPHEFKTSGSFDDKVQQIARHIVPENLPLEFKFNA